jgi:LacI family transcriptional regulator/LacI family purine nucleotide synthesis repressor/LacI family repressor for deo operon, udp, cdd, tsx, nupC, and nupG
MKRNITIYEIAKEAGVSVSTVSRVLTGNANVSEKRMKKVMDVIEKYDYHPNSIARSLSNKKSHTIGIILPDITHPFYSQIFYGAEAQALVKGYTLLLGCTMNDTIKHITNLEAHYIRILQEKKVDGMIIMGGAVNETNPIKEHMDMIARLNERMPVVTVNDALPARDTLHVGVDETIGTRALVNYLVSLKHKRFAFIGGDLAIEPTQTRLNTMIESLAYHGIEFDMDFFIPNDFNVESGKKCMVELLQKSTMPTAVICLNDLVAIGAIYTARKAGLVIPDDISIVGSDNMPISEYVVPALTTVDLKALEIGKKAIEVLVNSIEGKKNAKENYINTELVIRDSCRICK